MKPASITAAYVVLYPQLSEVARAHGYALATHGTNTRDMDLVAIPWTELAVDALTLVRAMRDAVGGCFVCVDREVDDKYYHDGWPTQKPHGRVAYSIHLTGAGSGGPYLDVMPRQ